MNEPVVERRVAALIAAYADRAPTDVDAVRMARLAATGVPTVGWDWLRPLPRYRSLALGLVTLALLVGLAAGFLLGGGSSPLLVAASPSPLAPASTPPDRIAVGSPGPSVPAVMGYLGLPPRGVTPSQPDLGDLVFAYVARAGAEISRPGAACCPKEDFFLYADGRLIRETEASASELSTGFLEQRLTPAGVEYARSAIELTGLFDLAYIEGSGSFWGSATLVRDGRPAFIEWGTGWDGKSPRSTAEARAALRQLHGWVIDPGAWLPAGAWAEREVRAFVPARFAACVYMGDPEVWVGFKSLPATAAAIRDRGAPTQSLAGGEVPSCRTLGTEDARAFVAALVDEGFREVLSLNEQAGSGLDLAAPSGYRPDLYVSLDPVLPDGRPRCRCG